jgi:hypothetical protein
MSNALRGFRRRLKEKAHWLSPKKLRRKLWRRTTGKTFRAKDAKPAEIAESEIDRESVDRKGV